MVELPDQFSKLVRITTQRDWELVECKCSEQTGLFRYILDNFHKYMKYKDTCNRRINWLIYYRGEIAGAFGLNNAIMAMEGRDKFIGWGKEQRLKKIGKNIANNYRFCLMKEGLPTSQLLNLACRVGAKRWKEKYGDTLYLVESLVKPPFKGTVYRAAGWVYVGMTKGTSFSKAPLKSWQKENSARGELARRDPDSAVKKYAVGKEMYAVKQSEPKLVFVHPLMIDWRTNLL